MVAHLTRTIERPPQHGIFRSYLLQRVQIDIAQRDIFGIERFLFHIVSHRTPQPSVVVIILVQQFSTQFSTVDGFHHFMSFTQDSSGNQREGNGILSLQDIVFVLLQLRYLKRSVGIMTSRIVTITLIFIIKTIQLFEFLTMRFGIIHHLLQVIDSLHTFLLILLTIGKTLVEFVKPIFHLTISKNRCGQRTTKSN